MTGRCAEGDRCVCGGDLPAIRADCANWRELTYISRGTFLPDAPAVALPPGTGGLADPARRDALAREIVRRRGRYSYAYSERGAVGVVRSVLDELAAILSPA